jgi:hypothetical protein
MSRESSGKSPISTLAWRFSLFLVTPFYLIIVWVFDPLLNTYGFLGKMWWLFVWWACSNLGAFSLSVGVGWPLLRAVTDWIFERRREYWDWRRAGGDPFWDVLPWPINIDPPKVRMAITIPPDQDVCPIDGFPLGRRFGNQCRACGRFYDKGYP